jgi:subtilisin family serine protease
MKDRFCCPIDRPLNFETLEDRRLLAGLTTTQGDTALYSDIIKDAFGLYGTGVRIGVISNTYNKLDDPLDPADGAGGDVINGDLPGFDNPFGYNLPVIVRNDPGVSSPTDEGRAMLQIIHDIAPGAELFFYGLGQSWTETNLAAAIRDLRDQGAQIIVDDLTALSAPFFEDGVVTAAIDEVVNQDNVTYITSAGNEGRRSYESTFSPGSSTQIIPGTFAIPHLFAPGDYKQSITIPSGGSISIVLQWTEPYSPPPEFRFNLYLVDSAGQNQFPLVTGSPLNPVRSLIFNNSGSNTEFDLMIAYIGTVPPAQAVQLKYYEAASSSLAPEFNAVFNEYLTNSSTIFAHANSEYAITVGAADYRNTPAFGQAVPIVTDYSSAGGTPIIFPVPETGLRPKPDIVGPDNGNTTFFLEEYLGVYPALDPENDGLPNFAGTSAAAPHIAGLVALMLQANPSLTPAQVKQALIDSAIDMDDPSTTSFDTGFDYGTGHGFVDGLKALTEVIPPKVMDVIISGIGSTHDDYVFSEAIFNGNPVIGSGDQLRTVPVGGANAVRVAFSEMVTNITIDSLRFVGVTTGIELFPTSFIGPSEANDLTATWQFPSAITTSDYYLLSLSDSVEDLDGNALDGDWTNPSRLFQNPTIPGDGPLQHTGISEFPSGDGTAGGDFNFVLTIFPGDAIRDLTINTADLLAVLNNFFGPGGWAEGDFDGDGTPMTPDLLNVLNQFFVSLGPLQWRFDLNQNNAIDQGDLDIWDTYAIDNSAGDYNGDGFTDSLDRQMIENLLDLYFESIG